ncbi:MAG TPA: flagellar basal body rod protein FlgB [Burkholderiales bacterium]|jgi:flagellar basal-body rod protein FlgB
MIGQLDNLLQLQSEALKLRAQRQEVIASNLANGDTPNYKAMDFKFSDALRQAVGMPSAQGSAPALVQTSAGHMNAQGSTLSTVQLLYRTPTQARVDGNTVDTNVEQANFADNAVRYEASLRFLNGQIKTMLSAIQG